MTTTFPRLATTVAAMGLASMVIAVGCTGGEPDEADRAAAEEAVADETIRTLDANVDFGDDLESLNLDASGFAGRVGRVSFAQFGDDPPFFPEPTALLDRVSQRDDLDDRYGPAASEFLTGAGEVVDGYQSTDRFADLSRIGQFDLSAKILSIALVVSIGGPIGEVHAEIALEADDAFELDALFTLDGASDREFYLEAFRSEVTDGFSEAQGSSDN